MNLLKLKTFDQGNIAFISSRYSTNWNIAIGVSNRFYKRLKGISKLGLIISMVEIGISRSIIYIIIGVIIIALVYYFRKTRRMQQKGS